MFKARKVWCGTLVAVGFLLSFNINTLAQDHSDHHNHEHHVATETPVEHHEDHQDEHHEEEGFNPTEMIMHHVTDAHEWHILDYTNDAGEEVAVSLPLPIILYTDGNLDVFMSSGFHHGESSVVKGDREYVLNHGHIEEVNGASILDLSITKNVASMLLGAFLLLWIFTAVARAYSKRNNQAPKGLQSFMEPLILFVRDDIAIPNIGEAKYHRFMPFLLTVFFFIWFNNLLGLIPFFPGGANLTGNIAVTMVLAAITLILTNVNGNKDYWKHIFNTPGVPWWLKFPLPLMPAVEFVGVLAKPFALMIRLFANITAGHIIILSLISLIFIFKSLAVAPVAVGFVLFMNVLELLVAALQAYIFTLLSALFIGSAVAEHEHH